jgi:hypothetical protein
VLQVLVAEWLYVYAGVSEQHDAASMLSMTKARGLPEPYVGTEAPGDVRLAQSGRHIPSFTSLLGYCADWIGTVAPSYVSISSGDLGKAVRTYTGNALRILPSRLPLHSPVHAAFVTGKALPPTLFIRYLNAMLQLETHALHATRIVVATAASHALTHVRVRAFSRKQQHSVCNPMDLTLVCPAEYTASVPAEISLPTQETSDAIAGISVVVCWLNDSDWFPVFPGALTDAALQKVVIHAMADTLVQAISVKTPGYAELREVTGKALLLNVSTSASADFVKAAVHAAFRETFPKSVAAAAVAAAAVSSSPGSSSARQSPALQPKAFIPHYKLSLLTFYFTPSNFVALEPELQAIQAFLENVKLVKESGSDALWLTDAAGGVTGKVSPSSDAAYKFRVDAVTSSTTLPSGTVDILGTPMLAVPFMREDLLSIALSGKRSQQTFKRLWALHQRDIVGNYFDDDTSDAIAEHVVGGGVLRHADAWSPGVLMQVVFSGDDAQLATELLQTLFAELKLFAFVYEGETFLTQQKPAEGFVVPEATLERSEDGSDDDDAEEGTGGGKDSDVLDVQELAMYALEEHSSVPSRIAVRDVEAIVTPFVRGICVTTAQIAVIRGVGSEELQTSLETILRAAEENVAELTSSQLARCMKQDLATVVMVK